MINKNNDEFPDNYKYFYPISLSDHYSFGIILIYPEDSYLKIILKCCYSLSEELEKLGFSDNDMRRVEVKLKFENNSRGIRICGGMFEIKRRFFVCLEDVIYNLKQLGYSFSDGIEMHINIPGMTGR